MNCPECGSRGMPLPHHSFLRDGYQCSNPDCMAIYAAPETLDLAEETRELQNLQVNDHRPESSAQA